jgi:hypothetical protein
MGRGGFPSQKFRSFYCLEALKPLLSALTSFKISEHSLRFSAARPVARTTNPLNDSGGSLKVIVALSIFTSTSNLMDAVQSTLFYLRI